MLQMVFKADNTYKSITINKTKVEMIICSFSFDRIVDYKQHFYQDTLKANNFFFHYCLGMALVR